MLAAKGGYWDQYKALPIDEVVSPAIIYLRRFELQLAGA